ncbi:MAG: sodium:proton antiporter NhaD [Candidatus Methylumidiphilus sp.]
MIRHQGVWAGSSLALLPNWVFASADAGQKLDLSRHWVGYGSLGLFVVAYVLVVFEETLNLRKSKPMMLAAALIWAGIALVYRQANLAPIAEAAMRQDVLDYSEVLLFLVVSLAYINAMEERLVFANLRAWLVNRGYGYRQLFWLTGVLAFLVSSLTNNMATAMLMCAVVMAVGKDNPKFVAISCVNIVVAANAGGTFCPLGDITTLLVWQKGPVAFLTFYKLFLPALLNFTIPAAIMAYAVPDEKPQALREAIHMRRGARRIVALFLLAILTAVGFEYLLRLPAAAGMMAGLSYLQFFSYYLRLTDFSASHRGDGKPIDFDIFTQVARLEWDTLLFFYGVVLCLGGINFIGYLAHASGFLYGGAMGAASANILVGLLSSVVDNIPLMLAIVTMHPDMSTGQWLLVTLTAGVGGSLLSVGSAAGITLMGQAKGVYTFTSHLKWTPVIFLGYIGSIAAHFFLNADLF